MRLVVALAVAMLVVSAAPGSDAASPGTAGRIAFSLERNGISRIYTVRPDGTGRRLLSQPPLRQLLGGDSGPVWSGDGRRIAFERDLPYWGEDRFRLNVVDAGGGRGKAITAGPFDVMPTWSPDGKRIAFVRVTGAGDLGATASLYVTDRFGRSAVQLTSGRLDLTPAWSPDGTKIAFARLPGTPAPIDEAQLFVADADGSNVRPLGLAGISPAWSPNGVRLAFVSFSDHNGRTCGGADCVPNGEVYAASADGAGAVRLTHSRADDQHPTWSPDGTRIAFASGFELSREGHAPWLVVVPADGGRVHRIGRFSGIRDPAWSPASVR